jgi:lipopolysaccharide export system permease protein
MELSPDKRFLVFRLFNGTNYEERIDLKSYESRRPFQRTAFKEQYQMFDLSAFQLTRTDESLFKKNYEMQNVAQLALAIDSISAQLSIDQKNYQEGYVKSHQFFALLDSKLAKKSTVAENFNPSLIFNFSKDDRFTTLETARNAAIAARQTIESNKNFVETKSKLVRKHLIVYHKKFSFSIACFLLFFIGAPLGAIIRKGGLGMPAVVSTLFFILFWVISFAGEKYALEGEVAPWQGIWFSSAVLMPIGVFLTVKATNDASLFDAESWSRTLKRLFKKEPGL